MKLRIKQGSPDWVELRKSKITSTDCAVILKMSPYKSPEKLLLQKLDMDAPDEINEAMRTGTELEPLARDLFQRVTGHVVFPAVYLHNEHNWMMASLDGIDFEEEIILEIKCSQIALDKLRNGEIPSYYFAQMQHALAVTGAKKCIYFTYFRGEYEMIDVYPDAAFVERMIPLERDFYDQMLSADLTELAIEERDDDAFEEAVKAWKDIKAKLEPLKKLEELEKQARLDLGSLIEGRGAKGFGITVKRNSRAGTVDYSAIPELTGVNLEKYRKPKTFWWGVSEDSSSKG